MTKAEDRADPAWPEDQLIPILPDTQRRSGNPARPLHKASTAKGRCESSPSSGCRPDRGPVATTRARRCKGPCSGRGGDPAAARYDDLQRERVVPGFPSTMMTIPVRPSRRDGENLSHLFEAFVHASFRGQLRRPSTTAPRLPGLAPTAVAGSLPWRTMLSRNPATKAPPRHSPWSVARPASLPAMYDRTTRIS